MVIFLSAHGYTLKECEVTGLFKKVGGISTFYAQFALQPQGWQQDICLSPFYRMLRKGSRKYNLTNLCRLKNCCFTNRKTARQISWETIKLLC